MEITPLSIITLTSKKLTCVNNGVISTDLYSKPTDKRQYLFHTSCYPINSCKKGIPFGQALRLRCILRLRREDTETELSKHIWTLKDAKKPFEIKWKVLKRCQPYNNLSKKCNLCLHEKFVIICRKDLCTLNKRNELASSCPHRNRYVLKNFRIT